MYLAKCFSSHALQKYSLQNLLVYILYKWDRLMKISSQLNKNQQVAHYRQVFIFLINYMTLPENSCVI